MLQARFTRIGRDSPLAEVIILKDSKRGAVLVTVAMSSIYIVKKEQPVLLMTTNRSYILGGG